MEFSNTRYKNSSLDHIWSEGNVKDITLEISTK